MAKSVARSRRGRKPQPRAPRPAVRRLQVFSLDPSLDSSFETASISRTVLTLPWEDLAPGPVGAYVEVVDVDPASRRAYPPAHLDDPTLYLRDGHAPSTGNPKFHQQMVYAVVMTTIGNFERVLGREVMWAERTHDERNVPIQAPEKRYVPRLRIYPHALRDQNAYYSPQKRALLFGYFNAPSEDPRDELPGGVVFTCLSHDIIAHETTHAILDGLHPRLLEATNPDMLAFHEGFADVVAIFQHFTLPGLLRDQIQRTRGDLRTDNLLAALATQFARSTGRGAALRNALGTFLDSGAPAPPDPAAFRAASAPHERGAILVAAVFDAFIRLYDARVADLRRLATGGSGILPEGDLHPDLVGRLAEEAVAAADRTLRICIRAVDYLPPVDVTLGDFLRGLITADADYYPDDTQRYRLAFIDAFRERGIYPLDVRTLAEDTLAWNHPTAAQQEMLRALLPPPEILRAMAYAYDSLETPLAGLAPRRSAASGLHGRVFGRLKAGRLDEAADLFLALSTTRVAPTQRQTAATTDRRWARFRAERFFRQFLQIWISRRGAELGTTRAKRRAIAWLLGLDLERAAPIEVHAFRPSVRRRQHGASRVDLVITLTQSEWRGLREPNKVAPHTTPGFFARGGCTMHVDPVSGDVRYSIVKSIGSEARPQRSADFFFDELRRLGPAAADRYGLTRGKDRLLAEPFALAHTDDSAGEGY